MVPEQSVTKTEKKTFKESFWWHVIPVDWIGAPPEEWGCDVQFAFSLSNLEKMLYWCLRHINFNLLGTNKKVRHLWGVISITLTVFGLLNTLNLRLQNISSDRLFSSNFNFPVKVMIQMKSLMAKKEIIEKDSILAEKWRS